MAGGSKYMAGPLTGGCETTPSTGPDDMGAWGAGSKAGILDGGSGKLGSNMNREGVVLLKEYEASEEEGEGSTSNIGTGTGQDELGGSRYQVSCTEVLAYYSNANPIVGTTMSHYLQLVPSDPHIDEGLAR
jgi:hypothetical protein